MCVSLKIHFPLNHENILWGGNPMTFLQILVEVLNTLFEHCFGNAASYTYMCVYANVCVYK